MLDIGWSELLLVAVVAVVVVGPKELPKLMRTFGFYAGKLRRAASDFQRQFEEAMVESEAEEVRKNIEAIQGSLGDQPLMMPQNALGEPLSGEPMAALQAEAHASAKRKAPRAKTSGNKTAPKPKRKPTRAKPTATKRATTKPRKTKVAAKAAAKPRAKTTTKKPTRARRKS